MMSYLKIAGLGVALGMSSVAHAAQQPQYQTPIRQMGQGMGQPGQMMSQPGQMMNDPQMRAQMEQMRQGCERMMTDMRDRMPQPNRR